MEETDREGPSYSTNTANSVTHCKKTKVQIKGMI